MFHINPLVQLAPGDAGIGFIGGVDLISRMGRAHPRVTVSRHPPGMSRRDLIGTNPSLRIVGAMRRPLAVVFGRQIKSRRLCVLMASMPRTAASTFARKGSASRPARSLAFARWNSSINVSMSPIRLLCSLPPIRHKLVPTH